MSKESARTTAQPKFPRVHFHACRRKNANQPVAAGVNVLTISRRLWHGFPTPTLHTCGHLRRNANDEDARMTECAFGGS
jgi:hypothetical protein